MYNVHVYTTIGLMQTKCQRMRTIRYLYVFYVFYFFHKIRVFLRILFPIGTYFTTMINTTTTTTNNNNIIIFSFTEQPDKQQKGTLMHLIQVAFN